MNAGAPVRTRPRKDRADFTITVPYQAPGPIQQWFCSDTVAELRGWAPRPIQTRPRPSGVALTWFDGLAGCGGSTKGIFDIPGQFVAVAQNHWPEAVEDHNDNFPDTDHDVANVARVDPRRYPRTDCAWFSPECTKWSIAAGRPCDFDTDWEQPSLFAEEGDVEDPAEKETRWRSRLLMTDVIRFTRVHRYKGVIVENVPEILKWHNFGRWLQEMTKEGYNYKVITLNSAFAGAYGDPAPQLRDRVFIVFWHQRYRTPNWDKWLRPLCWCVRCEKVVRGRFTAKPPTTRQASPYRPMLHNAQYYYRCPNHGQDRVRVQPYVLPARAAVDITKVGQRIGDRKRPIADATRERVGDGLVRQIRRIRAAQAAAEAGTLPAVAPMLVPTGGTWRDQAASVDVPMATRTTRETDALVTVPPFLTVLRSGRPRTIEMGAPLAAVVADGSGHALVVPTEGRDGVRARDIDEPLRTQTGRHLDAVATPPLVVPLRNNGVARPVDEHPIPTVAAGGEHIALVMRNNTARGDSGQMSTPVGEPLRTLTTTGHQSFVSVGDPALFGYDTGLLRPLEEPLPTQTTVEGDALLHTAVDVDDCHLRMLEVDEIRAGMGFPGGYILRGSKRSKVRKLGNAVVPGCSRDLVGCLTEAILGEEYELAGWAA